MDADQPPGARYVVDVGPDDVGARVVLRRRLPGGRLSDVLGHVSRWSDGVVVVDTGRGTVEVPEADLVAAKRIPAWPARRPPVP